MDAELPSGLSLKRGRSSVSIAAAAVAEAASDAVNLVRVGPVSHVVQHVLADRFTATG